MLPQSALFLIRRGIIALKKVRLDPCTTSTLTVSLSVCIREDDAKVLSKWTIKENFFLGLTSYSGTTFKVNIKYWHDLFLGSNTGTTFIKGSDTGTTSAVGEERIKNATSARMLRWCQYLSL